MGLGELIGRTMMQTAADILGVIRSHRTELRRLGVRRLGLFGSAARGEATEASDLDFLVEFEHKTFDSYMEVKELLARLFGRRIDLVIAEAVKPQLRERILGETVYAEGL
jgi:predicted nucleotidyltransferase